LDAKLTIQSSIVSVTSTYSPKNQRKQCTEVSKLIACNGSLIPRNSVILTVRRIKQKPMLAPHVEYLPHYIYMSLWTEMTRAEIASLFSASCWSSRKCSWTDYEVRSEDNAELVIESENPMLVHGPIDSASEMVPVIRKILDDAGISYSFEAYNERDEIVASLTEEELKGLGEQHGPN
jgi:hypothetical protein